MMSFIHKWLVLEGLHKSPAILLQRPIANGFVAYIPHAYQFILTEIWFVLALYQTGGTLQQYETPLDKRLIYYSPCSSFYYIFVYIWQWTNAWSWLNLQYFGLTFHFQKFYNMWVEDLSLLGFSWREKAFSACCPTETMKNLLGINEIFKVMSNISYIGGYFDHLAKTSKALIS